MRNTQHSRDDWGMEDFTDGVSGDRPDTSRTRQTERERLGRYAPAVFRPWVANERAFSVGGNQYREGRTRTPEIATPLQWRSLIFSFPGVNQHTRNKKYDSQNYEPDAQDRRQFFKKVTREPYREYSLSKIRHILGDEFAAIFVDSNHAPISLSGVYHVIKALSILGPSRKTR